MRTETVIDTVAIQVNFYDEVECSTVHDNLFERLERYGYKVDNRPKVEYHNKDVARIAHIATIDKGTYSYKKQNMDKEKQVWYLSITLAGLKKYIPWRDKVSHNCLLLIISYLKTNRYPYEVKQFDVALNIFTKYENTMVLCTNKVKKREYYEANEKQLYSTTKWIEKFRNAKHKADAIFCGCHYCKATKEKLKFPLTRHEVSYQKNFFKANGFDIGAIYNEFNRYHVLYAPNKKKQQEIKDWYDSKEVIRHKDIKNMRLERYRLHIDINVLVSFATLLYVVDDETLEYHLYNTI
jgi:hypothetical protein